MALPLDQNQAELYESAGTVNTFSFEPGVCVLPLAEDPPTDPYELAAWSPVVVLRLHAPYRLRKTTTRATKYNNPPPTPAPQDTGAFVFIGGQTLVSSALNNSGTNFDWAVNSEHLYVENCVSRVQDGLVLGSPPFNWQTSLENVVSGTYVPALGAIRYAGPVAQAGYFQATQMQANIITGELKTYWGYNSPEFYPGNLFYSDQNNAGAGIIPPPDPEE